MRRSTVQLAAIGGLGVVVGLAVGVAGSGAPWHAHDGFVRPAPPDLGPVVGVAIDPDDLARAEAQRGEARVLVVAPEAATAAADALAAQLRSAGWANVTVGGADDPSPATIVFHRPGFDVVARLLLDDLGWTDVALAELPQVAAGAADVADLTVSLSSDGVPQ